jgi:excisionase family DNA binding protein
MTGPRTAYLSQADGETRTPDPIITSERGRSNRSIGADRNLPISREDAEGVNDLAELDRTQRSDTDAPETPLDEWVYKCFAADGQALYVGITARGLSRFGGHRARSPEWTTRITTIGVEHFQTRGAAEQREIQLIRDLRPLHNHTYAAPEGSLTVEQVAARLRVSVKHVLRFIADGELDAHRFGSKYIVTTDAIEDLVDARANKPRAVRA